MSKLGHLGLIMSFSAATSQCPFVSRVSTKFLQKSGKSLGMYGQKCPVMSKLFHTAAKHAVGPGEKQALSLGEILNYNFELELASWVANSCVYCCQ